MTWRLTHEQRLQTLRALAHQPKPRLRTREDRERAERMREDREREIQHSRREGLYERVMVGRALEARQK